MREICAIIKLDKQKPIIITINILKQIQEIQKKFGNQSMS
jgi:hypothetical protein